MVVAAAILAIGGLGWLSAHLAVPRYLHTPASIPQDERRSINNDGDDAAFAQEQE